MSDKEILDHLCATIINISNGSTHIDEIITISSNGLNFNDNELCKNFANCIVEYLIIDQMQKIPSNDDIIRMKKILECYKIIIRNNPHLLNNRMYVGNGGCPIDLYIIQLLLYGRKMYKLELYDDRYLKILYSMFVFNISIKNDIELMIKILLYVNAKDHIYQNRCYRHIFEVREFNKILDVYANNINIELLNDIYEHGCRTIIDDHQQISKITNNSWFKLLTANNDNNDLVHILNLYSNTYDNIKYFINKIIVNSNIDLISQCSKYHWFRKLFRYANSLPKNDKTMMTLIKDTNIRRIIVSNANILFELVRRRKTHIIKYLWRHEKNKLEQLRNNDNQTLLEYAMTCSGLMHNIIDLLQNKKLI